MNIMFLLSLFTLSMGELVYDDSCPYANDGTCDEPFLDRGCILGTDTTDCILDPYTLCKYINDGVCDEGPDHQYCLPGTDTNDCCENGTLKVWNETDINSGRNLSDAICEDFLLEHRKIMSYSPVEEHVPPPSYSGVLECGKVRPKKEEKEAKDQFLSSLFFQAIFVYCSCIYYQRIIDGLEFIRDNIEIIFNIWCTIMKCIAYFILLALSVGVIITAMEDNEKKETLLKLTSFVCFLDYIDERNHPENGNEEETNEEEEYQRWRRRRDRYN